MIVIKNILVPIDFSDSSKQVLALGRMLADACGASMHLLHVISPVLSSPSTIDEERHHASRRLNALLDETDRSSRHATTFCEVGTPAHEIVRYATDHGVDLIVMGTHWHGPTFQMATGSIAEGVLGSAPCAVLAVKETAPGGHVQASDLAPAATTS
jgi:nucleotide-binding universal stress UspA family protein